MKIIPMHFHVDPKSRGADIVCIQESKLSNLDSFTSAAIFPSFLRSYHYQPSTGSSGGLITDWRNAKFKANLFDCSDSALTCSFHSTTDQTSFLITNIYAPHANSERQEVFDLLTALRTTRLEPWMCIGDFNIYRFPHEKNNDNLNTRGMEEFNSWINGEGLFDIDIPNRKFSWSNKRRCPTLVKLDRVLIDTAWNQTFANASAKALIATTSDHIPILAEFSNNCSSSDFFRLENYWLQMPDFIEMTETNWGRGTRPLSAISKLNHKLRRLRASTKA